MKERKLSINLKSKSCAGTKAEKQHKVTLCCFSVHKVHSQIMKMHLDAYFLKKHLTCYDACTVYIALVAVFFVPAPICMSVYLTVSPMKTLIY